MFFDPERNARRATTRRDRARTARPRRRRRRESPSTSTHCASRASSGTARSTSAAPSDQRERRAAPHAERAQGATPASEDRAHRAKLRSSDVHVRPRAVSRAPPAQPIEQQRGEREQPRRPARRPLFAIAERASLDASAAASGQRRDALVAQRRAWSRAAARPEQLRRETPERRAQRDVARVVDQDADVANAARRRRHARRPRARRRPIARPRRPAATTAAEIARRPCRRRRSRRRSRRSSRVHPVRARVARRPVHQHCPPARAHAESVATSMRRAPLAPVDAMKRPSKQRQPAPRRHRWPARAPRERLTSLRRRARQRARRECVRATSRGFSRSRRQSPRRRAAKRAPARSSRSVGASRAPPPESPR